MKILLILCLFLVSCGVTCAMTRPQYDCVMIGTPITEVMAISGEPYSVRSCGDGTEEYEYIERLSMNGELVYENHYFLTVANGEVVSKRIKQENRPAYDLMYDQDPNYPTYP